MLKSIIAALAVCLFAWCGTAGAESGMEPNPAGYTQEWHLLPGESLKSLAALFYPKSKAMQHRFIAKAVAMNPDVFASHPASQPFEDGATISIPDIHALSYHAPRSVRHSAVRHQAAPMASAASESMANAGPAPSAGSAPAKEMEALDQRNQEHTEKLAALNERLKSLEDKSKELNASLAKTAAALPKSAEAAGGSAPAASPAEEPKRSLKRVQPVETPVAEESGLNLTLALLAAAAVLIGLLGYRWHKSRSK